MATVGEENDILQLNCSGFYKKDRTHKRRRKNEQKHNFTINILFYSSLYFFKNGEFSPKFKFDFI